MAALCMQQNSNPNKHLHCDQTTIKKPALIYGYGHHNRSKLHCADQKRLFPTSNKCYRKVVKRLVLIIRLACKI